MFRLTLWRYLTYIRGWTSTKIFETDQWENSHNNSVILDSLIYFQLASILTSLPVFVTMGSMAIIPNFLVIHDLLSMILVSATSRGDWNSFTCKLVKEGIQMDFPTPLRLHQRPHRTPYIIQLYLEHDHASSFHICQPAFTNVNMGILERWETLHFVLEAPIRTICSSELAIITIISFHWKVTGPKHLVWI